MSRKYRQEQNKLKQLNQEFQEELDRVKLQKERIFAPIVWEEFPDLGLQIQDLKPPLFDDAIKLIEENYFTEELLCRNTNLAEDEESVKSFLERIRFFLNYKQSIGIVKVDTNEVVGVLILKTVQKSDYDRVFGRVQILKGNAFKEVNNFLGQVARKIDIYEHYGVDVYLEFILLCISVKYRHMKLGLELLSCGMRVAYSLKCPIASGIFQTYHLQTLSKKIGMQVLRKFSYLDWKDEDGELIFPEPGAGNYYCAVMAGEVHPPPPPPSPPPPPTLKERLLAGMPLYDEKKTRVERLAEMAKEKKQSMKQKTILSEIK